MRRLFFIVLKLVLTLIILGVAIWSAGFLYFRLSVQRGVEMPITSELHRILFQGKAPQAAVSDLMVRLPRMEWELLR